MIRRIDGFLVVAFFSVKAIKNRNVLFTDWEHAGSYDLVALEQLLLSYGTLKHMTNVSYACA